jgi:hypothetical protein
VEDLPVSLLLCRKSGPAWRVAPGGSTEVYFDRILPDGVARVFSHGYSGWAKRPMLIPAEDVFETKAEALAEFRRRRDQRSAA